MIINTIKIPFHSIELTSRCNATCSYCPHSELGRGKSNITHETFINAIDILDKKYINKGKRLALHHFGEVFLLGDDLFWYLDYLEERKILWNVFSNGLLLGENEEYDKKFLSYKYGSIDISIENTNKFHSIDSKIEKFENYIKLAELVDSKLSIGVTHFGNEKVEKIIQDISKKRRIRNTRFKYHGWGENYKVKDKPSINPMNECLFLKNQEFVVLQNGNIVSCCFDAHGETNYGNVNNLNSIQLPIANKIWDKCKICPMTLKAKSLRRYSYTKVEIHLPVYERTTYLSDILPTLKRFYKKYNSHDFKITIKMVFQDMPNQKRLQIELKPYRDIIKVLNYNIDSDRIGKTRRFLYDSRDDDTDYVLMIDDDMEISLDFDLPKIIDFMEKKGYAGANINSHNALKNFFIPKTKSGYGFEIKPRSPKNTNIHVFATMGGILINTRRCPDEIVNPELHRYEDLYCGYSAVYKHNLKWFFFANFVNYHDQGNKGGHLSAVRKFLKIDKSIDDLTMTRTVERDLLEEIKEHYLWKI